jgi:hypothetical protein
MAIPKNLQTKLLTMALDDAAEDMEEYKSSDDVESLDKGMEACKCPSCGHTGAKSEFMDNAEG